MLVRYLDRDVVVLQDNRDSRQVGQQSVWLASTGVHAVIGDVKPDFAVEPGFLAKQVLRLSGPEGTIFRARNDSPNAWINGWLAEFPADLGIVAAEVVLTANGLRLPAWHQQGSNTWVIHVHGRTARRAETLRNFEVFHSLGFTNLAISLRNNNEADDFSHRRSHLAELEWQDLQAAVGYAKANGAHDIILFGISQGAVACAEFMRKSKLVSLVRSVILDSPVVNWWPAIYSVASDAGLSKQTVSCAFKLLESKWSARLLGLQHAIQVEKLGFHNWCESFSVPIMAMHSVDDGYVPIDPVREVSRSHSKWFQLVEFKDAGHVKLFNLDPGAYQQTIKDFLARNAIL